MENHHHLVQVEYLSARKPVEQELVDCLTCPLCLCIVTEPRECINCEKLYCSEHVKEWSKTKKTCPTCRAKPWKLKPRCHRVYLQLLESLQFSCPCGKDIPYNQLIAHKFWDHIEAEKERKKREAEMELERQKQLMELQAQEEARRQQQLKAALIPKQIPEHNHPRINIVSVTRRENQQKLQPSNNIVSPQPIRVPIQPAIQQHVGLKQSVIRSKLEVKFNHNKEQEKHEEPVPAVPDKEQHFIPLTAAKKYYFYFRPKAQHTVFLNRQSNEQINNNLRNKITSFDLLIDSKHVLYFELGPMRVTDPVKEVVFDLEAEEIVHAVWRYSLNRNDFVFPPETAAVIEQAFRLFQKKEGPKTFEIDFENTRCEVDLEKMQYTNLDTKSVRQIKRRKF